MKVPHSAVLHKHPAHPWVIASCFVLGLGILAAAAFWIRRCKSSSVPKHEYSALRLENNVDSNIFEKQIKDESFSTCQQYLSTTGRYDLQVHLGNIGSRPGKQWFIVKDKSLGADRLLSLTDIPSSCPLQSSEETRETLLDLFRSLQHPYIHPILDLEFWENGAALVTPLNACGSLKDLIYGVSWQESHERKYSGRGEGLSYRQVQCFGRQILEALLFLHNRSFPKLYHLHAGNVIIQNGVARLSALENALFSLPPKPPAEHDCVAFGYILFEMTAGYELQTPPNSAHLEIELEQTPKIAETLRYIFETSETNSMIENLLRNELFRGVELRELHRTTGISYTTSAKVSSLLEIVKNSSVPTLTKISENLDVLESRSLEEAVEEELNNVENETLTVVIETR